MEASYATHQKRLSQPDQTTSSRCGPSPVLKSRGRYLYASLTLPLLSFPSCVQVLFTSALTGQRVHKIYEAVRHHSPSPTTHAIPLAA